MSAIGNEPQVILLRWPRLRDLPRLLTFGLLGGLTIGLLFGLTVGLAFGLTGGLAVGLLSLWIMPLPRTASATPVTTYRIDRRTNMVGGLAVGLVYGLTVGLTGRLAVELAFGLTGGLVVGLAFGLMSGLMSGSARMVGLTQCILAITGAGRVNLMRVLEDAHQRQVLRQAGAVYQFRHAELQEHLAKVHYPRTRPTANKQPQ